MAATSYFDHMLSAPKPELPDGTMSGNRQLEVFTYSNSIWLRMGPVGQENGGENRYTVELPLAEAKELIEALETTVHYFGG